MKRFFINCTIYSLVFLVTASSKGTIDSGNHLQIDLTDPNDAKSKALWSPHEKLSITKDGLGWDGESNVSIDGWIKTKPLAIGLSWRPTFTARISFEVQPPGQVIIFSSGQKTYRDIGQVYVRYSPDLKNWSSWKVLELNREKLKVSNSEPILKFEGEIRVPYINRKEYSDLVSKYSTIDVPWKSDEEAAVKWIIEKDPEFFSRQIPFIGYVEFLYENQFRGGKRINTFTVEISWVVGGKHLPPKDKSVYRDRNNKPWNFTAEERY